MNALKEKDKNVIVGTLLAMAIILPASSTYAEDDYQQNVLFNPSPGILWAEARGRIMIYDGLKNETVELALTEQFDRIENMMFVRTQYEQEDDELEEDDDC